MARLNVFVSDFLRSFDCLREKLAKELSMQKERACVRQERAESGDYHLAVLRKISFKKEKTCLSHRLKDIETLNKKLVKF